MGGTSMTVGLGTAGPAALPREGWSVGVYLRLSMEDGGKPGSASMSSQLEIVLAALSRMADMHVFGVYEDNGATGTNMDRAGFNRLMDDVRAGKVDCVAVKDLSRLARNALEAEGYMCEVLPALGCRLIAVADGYDSLEEGPDGRFVARLKNVMNEAHSRDLSTKARSTKLARMRAGRLAYSRAPYGYEKDPADPSRLVPRYPEAGVVRRIFDEALAGRGPVAVARGLNADGVPSPAGIAGGWGYRSVTRLLASEVYTGTRVMNRRESGVFCQHAKARPADEHIRLEHAHEPIVSRAEFDALAVSRMLVSEHRRAAREAGAAARVGCPDMLAGRAYCGDCGGRMAFDRDMRGGAPRRPTYDCVGHLRKGSCTSHRFEASALVAEVIRAARREVARGRRRLAGSRSADVDRLQASCASLAGRLDRALNSLDTVRKRRAELFGGYAAGKIGEGAFRREMDLCTRKAARARANAISTRGVLAEAQSRLEHAKLVRGNLAGLPEDASDEALLDLVERVGVFSDGSVRVLLRGAYRFEGRERR